MGLLKEAIESRAFAFQRASPLGHWGDVTMPDTRWVVYVVKAGSCKIKPRYAEIDVAVPPALLPDTPLYLSLLKHMKISHFSRTAKRK